MHCNVDIQCKSADIERTSSLIGDIRFYLSYLQMGSLFSTIIYILSHELETHILGK